MRIHPSRCSIQRNLIRSDDWMTRSCLDGAEPDDWPNWVSPPYTCAIDTPILLRDLPARRTHGHTITSWQVFGEVADDLSGYSIGVRLLGQFSDARSRFVIDVQRIYYWYIVELLAFCVLSLGRQAPRVLAEEKPEASKETLRYLLKSRKRLGPNIRRLERQEANNNAMQRFDWSKIS